MDAYVVCDTLADKLAGVRVLTLNAKLAQKKGQACVHSRLQASRGADLDNWQNSHLQSARKCVEALRPKLGFFTFY